MYPYDGSMSAEEILCTWDDYVPWTENRLVEENPDLASLFESNDVPKSAQVAAIKEMMRAVWRDLSDMVISW